MYSAKYLKWKNSFFFVVFFLPLWVEGSVVVSEIAWMGSANGGSSSQNSNDEWIELYNAGENAVQLSGWTLSFQDRVISLEGSIASRGFFLLERTDDESVPGHKADLVYSGGLANTGATVTLRDEAGVERDVIVGGDNWALIGGNNETKETPQRTASGWVTASPTPKSVSISGMPSSQEQSGSGGSENASPATGPGATTHTGASTSASEGMYVPLKEFISVTAFGDRILVAGADALFEGKAYGTKKEPLKGARYIWNFGDGTIEEEQNLLHSYAYPGEYVVILTVASGEYTASDRFVVRVVPAQIALSRVVGGQTGMIELSNLSGEELSLSWWRIQAGDQFFTIPKGTILLPHGKLPFAARVTQLYGATPQNVRLLYPNGTEAAQLSLVVPVEDDMEKDTIVATVASSSVEPAPERVLKEAQINESTQVAAVGALPPPQGRRWVWWVGAIALLGGAIVAVSLSRVQPPKQEKTEFTIIDGD